ncbi:MAG: polyprenyl synthetase family protein, partial [Deltaproteobacteria bacterium]|nr:polyprenyl synthetase family protein [Deltaproteobacteria bacterium]
QDRFRRRSPAVWTLSGARNAVLLGDVIFASAIETMSAMGSEDGRLVSRAIAGISSGALLEQIRRRGSVEGINFGDSAAGLYERIISLKTGLLFGTACELGAVSAAAGEEARRRWFRYGSLLGEAYQIADDTHDIRKILSGGTAAPEAIAPLVPALLRFGEEMRPLIPSLLLEGIRGADGRLYGLLQPAVLRMEQEIERRLQSASAEVPAFTRRPFGALARRAPGDIIEMFTRAEGES